MYTKFQIAHNMRKYTQNIESKVFVIISSRRNKFVFTFDLFNYINKNMNLHKHSQSTNNKNFKAYE